MARSRGRPVQRIIACLWLSVLIFVATAAAQPAAPPQPDPSGKTNVPIPATLRLAQVVPRLPVVHLYAIARDEAGTPIAPQAGELSALLGPNNAPVAIVQDDGIGIVFLVDISASLKPPQFELIKAALIAWIGSLNPADRAAIVTLGSNVNTVQDFTGDKTALANAVRQLVARDQQTLLYQGLVQAIDLSRRLDASLPLRRAIVVLTDGLDDQQGGAGVHEVFDKLAVDPTPIYGIGASAQNNAKVDEALKNFSGITRASGGDFRRVDIKSLDKGYFDLRKIVDTTKHLTVNCPTCPADGSTLVTRLLMSKGPARLSSESVMVRLVGADGKITPPSPPAPTPAPTVNPVVEQPPAPPVEKPPRAVSSWSPQFIFKMIINVPIPWLIVALLAACGAIAGFIVWLTSSKKSDPPPASPRETVQDPDIIAVRAIGLEVSPRVSIASGTQQDKRRLRLYPIGHNELNPIDLLFEEELTVGRNPESHICINNDTQVSADHCTLSPKGNSILVQDACSRNGTRVNGIPINGFLHAEGDSILGVGRTELRMKLLLEGAR